MGRLVRNFLPITLLLISVGAIAVHEVVRQPSQRLRLSVVGHWAPVPDKGAVLRLGRSPDAELRLLDPRVDETSHAELDSRDRMLWNRSKTQRLMADGTEVTELGLEKADQLTLHVPKSLEAGASLRQIGRVATATAGPSTRPIELEVDASGVWERLRNGDALARVVILEQPQTGRRIELDPLEVYSVPEGRLVPEQLGFRFERVAGGKGLSPKEPPTLADGSRLALGESAAETWTVRLKLASPKKLVGRWPELIVRDGSVERRYVMGETALQLADWGRVVLARNSLKYRDLGKRAPLEVRRAGQVLTPGRTRVHSGSILKLGHTRYRLSLDESEARLEILARGGIDELDDWPSVGARLASILPQHYEDELVLTEGKTCLSTGPNGAPGEGTYFLRTSAGFSGRAVALMEFGGQRLRVRSVSDVAVWLMGPGVERHALPLRSHLRSVDDLKRYEAGEELNIGSRMEAAGLTLELRRPDHRPITSLVAAVVAAILGVAGILFFALHRPRDLAFAGATRTVYDLDPTSTRVRAVGQRVLVPAIEIPNLIVPAAAALTMAGMMLQLRFWLVPKLLGTSDFLLRQGAALVLGLVLFLGLGLRRPTRSAERGPMDGGPAGPLGVDPYIWLGMLFLLLTNLLTAVGIGSRHNGFFFRIPGIGLTIQFSAFAKIFFSIGFARMFAYGLQAARGTDSLGCEAHQLTWSRVLGPLHGGRGMELRSAIYSLRKVVFLAALLGAIFSFYVVQNDLGPGLIFTLTLTLFVAFVMGQYNRGLRGFVRFIGPQSFLAASVVGLVWIWLLLPREVPLPDNSVGSALAPVVDKVVERLNLWWEPWRFTRGEQVVQSLWAVSGTAEELSYFSNLHSDFAFSAAVHHYGMGGGLLLLGGLGVLFGSGMLLARALFRIGEDGPDGVLFARSFTVLLGCLMLCVEAAIHVGACLNFSPLTGVTLPFVSSGGSSLIVSWALIGVICSRLAKDRPARKTSLLSERAD